MAHSFSDLVADHLKDITDALRRPKIDAAAHAMGHAASRASGFARPDRVVLPATLVDHLVGGNHVVRDEGAPPTGFLIFARHNAGEGFRYRATIDVEADLSRFIDEAYRAILDRPADPSGRDIYAAHVRSGSIALVDLLTGLASSEEGLMRRTRVLVVPSTSRWLVSLSKSVETLDIAVSAAP